MLWLGIGAGVVIGALALLWGARSAWRAAMRAEIRAHLAETWPGWTLVEEGSARLRIQAGDDALQVDLTHLYRELSEIRSGDAAADRTARQERFRHFFAGAADSLRETSAALTPADRERVLPMLVGPSFLAELRSTVELPVRPVSGSSLAVVYVLDGAHAMSYLTEVRRSELELDAEALHALALANLRARTSSEPVRTALDQEGLVAVATGDGYDATRLLLVGEQLGPGERLAAAVPGRDMLVLSKVPDDGDWSGLAALAQTFQGDRPVLDRPLLVTASSIAEM
ncbi:MAG: DUF1444 family protein [Gemmatimonadetes bacterium]|nr:DUF1444 family protein [Gemmatimonadota bacterium]